MCSLYRSEVHLDASKYLAHQFDPLIFCFQLSLQQCLPSPKISFDRRSKRKMWNAHLLAQISFDRTSKRKTWNAHLLAQRLSGVTKTRTARPAFGGRVRASQIYHNVNIRHLPRLLFPKACREEQDIEEAQLDRWWQRRRRGRRQQVSERQLESKFDEQKREEKEAKTRRKRSKNEQKKKQKREKRSKNEQKKKQKP